MENEQIRANRTGKSPHLVSIINSDGLTKIINFSNGQSSKVMAAKILISRPYSCLVLRLSKRKEVARSKSKEEYLFDISKVDQIFNHLLKDQHIKILDRYKIPSPEKLKNKKYCKWHHSFNHTTINYVVFRNAIQKVLKEGRFKLANHGLIKMIVDIDPFPSIATNMISTLNYNFHPKTKKGKQLFQT